MIKFWWRPGSRIWIRIDIATLAKRALVEVCTIPVLLVFFCLRLSCAAFPKYHNITRSYDIQKYDIQKFLPSGSIRHRIINQRVKATFHYAPGLRPGRRPGLRPGRRPVAGWNLAYMEFGPLVNQIQLHYPGCIPGLRHGRRLASELDSA